jgi:hypothetical protein
MEDMAVWILIFLVVIMVLVDDLWRTRDKAKRKPRAKKSTPPG